MKRLAGAYGIAMVLLSLGVLGFWAVILQPG